MFRVPYVGLVLESLLQQMAIVAFGFAGVELGVVKLHRPCPVHLRLQIGCSRCVRKMGGPLCHLALSAVLSLFRNANRISD